MSKSKRIAVFGVVLAVFAAAFVMKEIRRGGTDTKAIESSAAATGAVSSSAPLPKLVDLGRGKCIPCKMMAPILEELKGEYAGRFVVDVIDVGQNREAAAKYGIKLIPTQIFIDATGKEVFRHEGFMSKEDILAKWTELGIDVKQKES